jgi:isopenicillin N synthase-like dioxygenase
VTTLTVPIIDIGARHGSPEQKAAVATAIDAACREAMRSYGPAV